MKGAMCPVEAEVFQIEDKENLPGKLSEARKVVKSNTHSLKTWHVYRNRIYYKLVHYKVFDGFAQNLRPVLSLPRLRGPFIDLVSCIVVAPAHITRQVNQKTDEMKA